MSALGERGPHAANEARLPSVLGAEPLDPCLDGGGVTAPGAEVPQVAKELRRLVVAERLLRRDARVDLGPGGRLASLERIELASASLGRLALPLRSLASRPLGLGALAALSTLVGLGAELSHGARRGGAAPVEETGRLPEAPEDIRTQVRVRSLDEPEQERGSFVDSQALARRMASIWPSLHGGPWCWICCRRTSPGRDAGRDGLRRLRAWGSDSTDEDRGRPLS